MPHVSIKNYCIFLKSSQTLYKITFLQDKYGCLSRLFFLYQFINKKRQIIDQSMNRIETLTHRCIFFLLHSYCRIKSNFMLSKQSIGYGPQSLTCFRLRKSTDSDSNNTISFPFSFFNFFNKRIFRLQALH